MPRAPIAKSIRAQKFPNVDGVVPIIHESGCGMPDGEAVTMLNQLLTNTLRHPNLGASIYIDLGCGKTCVECSAPVFQNTVPDYNSRVVNLTVQQLGGSEKTVERGMEVAEKLLHYANQFQRQPVSISKLIVGTECGGSDRWSGVTANPAVGVAADHVCKSGGGGFPSGNSRTAGRGHARPRPARPHQKSRAQVDGRA